ncbi:MAG: hypothetical protein WC702_04670 [Patescibacteria group bacterium]|jgi:hypothetical protein
MSQIVRFIVKPRINDRAAAMLKGLGVVCTVRSTQRQTELTERNIERASAAGRDGLRGDRTDAVGNRQADSGTPVFGWKAEGRQSVSLRCVLADVTRVFGWSVTGLTMFQKEGDRMYFLVVVLEAGKPALDMSPALQAKLTEILGRTFGHVHCFRNPDGSVTVNPAHALNDDEVGEIRDLRVLDTEAHMRCVPR